MSDARADAILKLGRNRVLAHATVFKARHSDERPPMHVEIINTWHSSAKRVLTMAFRGAAKSTLAEEVVTLEACFSLFKFAMLLGESRDRAIERLRSIKYELEFNESLHVLFGNMRGPVWNEDEIVLSNNTRIMAFGMEQSLRGLKHVHSRPDRLYGDDMESEETVKSPEAREKFAHKFMAVVLPLLDPGARIRLLGTPLDKEAFIVKLSKTTQWVTQKFPIEHVDLATGARIATWPARFPLQAIDDLKQSYAELGRLHTFAQEYMLEPEDESKKKFSAGMIKIEPTVRTWQPTIAVYDPARTVKKTSATTGHVVGSWIGNKLVLWEADGRFLMPNEIIADLFRVQDLYHPIKIGIEEDGLNEFIMQPLRHAQTQRRELLPIEALKAPKGKIPFIDSLQPFFKAGEIVFAQELPELRKQLLDFPTGRIDAPNALAYFLRLRPGLPIYDGFSSANVVANLQVVTNSRPWLCVNADGQYLTAALIQFVDGSFRVIADWVREGDAAKFADMFADARLAAGGNVQVVLGAKHYQSFNTIGLLPAVSRALVRVQAGGSEAAGRDELRGRFKQMQNGNPAVLVSEDAHWTLNAFSGGYCRSVVKSGKVSEFAEDGPYKVLCEGIEAFASLLQIVRADDTENLNYAYTSSGQRYMTARPGSR